MLANQKLYADDVKQVCLFPFEYMYMTQDEGGDFSHSGTYNIDLQGFGPNGRIYECPFYAPVDLRCVAIWDTGTNNRVYQSLEKVYFADGSLDYLTINFMHDNNPIHNPGDIILMGEVLGHTGTTGFVTGDHTHMCCGKGEYVGFTKRASGNWDLTNRYHAWDTLFVNDTVIVQGYGHDWREFQGGHPGPSPIFRKKKKFPWVLYARKLRT